MLKQILSCAEYSFRHTVFAAIIFLFVAPFSYAQEEEIEATGAEGQVITILQPQEGQLVTREMAHLLARIEDERVAYVVVRVNEHITPVIDISSPGYKEIFSNLVLVRIYFLPGINEVEVITKDIEGAEIYREKINLYYRDTFSSDTSVVPETFSVKPLHVDGREAVCKKCHRIEVDPVVDLDPVKKRDLFCIECHEIDMAEKKRHGTATWKCLSCHSSEGEPKYAIKDETGLFCADCHKDEINTLSNLTSIHPKFKGGECLICHGGHTPGDSAFLLKPVNQLCFECHKKIYTGFHVTPGHPLEGKKDKAREGKEFNCSSCHLPHASDKEALLRYKPGMVLCQVCHAK